MLLPLLILGGGLAWLAYSHHDTPPPAALPPLPAPPPGMAQTLSSLAAMENLPMVRVTNPSGAPIWAGSIPIDGSVPNSPLTTAPFGAVLPVTGQGGSSGPEGDHEYWAIVGPNGSAFLRKEDAIMAT